MFQVKTNCELVQNVTYFKENANQKNVMFGLKVIKCQIAEVI